MFAVDAMLRENFGNPRIHQRQVVRRLVDFHHVHRRTDVAVALVGYLYREGRMQHTDAWILRVDRHFQKAVPAAASALTNGS